MIQRDISVAALAEALTGGDRAALGRAITLVESRKEEDKARASLLVDHILPQTGKSVRIGITGVPGVGKSTFIESFGMYLLSQGKKLAVLAIDPSSSITRGSILGDKTRMEQLSVQSNAFIRPSASGGSLGGVTYKTYESVLLCEAAGFDVVLIETVGVGQSETEVSHLCDFFLLLMLAGAGDELQGIKRGIMELADGIAITKADSGNEVKADMAKMEYKRALHFLPASESGWIPEVKTVSSTERKGITEIWEMITRFERHQQAKGFFAKRRNDQQIFTFHRLLQEELKNRFFREESIRQKMTLMEQSILKGTISPYSALKQMLS
ncbi:methylmalonyl Co-A mutase-associated GTPase MeaB [Rurimicrobium arvi]|uniref:Methylmalonyl Co-A mutase-associated GTPase MeaB n=1 Tax=Rurimicrobium arvi TaxID=2049916 RepID=A0ABP8MR84_9BACT